MRQDMYVTMTDAGGNRDSNTALVYDPTTGTWVPSSSTPTPSVPQTTDTVVDTNPTSKVDSKTTAEKEFIEIEFNTLTGELALTSTEKSIRLKVNDTIKIEGLGKYLSGLYYVTAVRRTLSKDGGYTHSLSLLKNGFGDSLKKSQEVVETRKEEVPKPSPEIKVGDSVKIVGNAYYTNAHAGVKVPEWVKKKTLTVDGISKDGTRVRLMPIFSWVYLKDVQKV